eukprot:9942391-Prorocentrum_lima.AAC.1
MYPGAASAAAAASPGRDWICVCGWDNWPWRMECRECYRPRPPTRARGVSRTAPGSRTAARNASAFQPTPMQPPPRMQPPPNFVGPPAH